MSIASGLISSASTGFLASLTLFSPLHFFRPSFLRLPYRERWAGLTWDHFCLLSRTTRRKEKRIQGVASFVHFWLKTSLIFKKGGWGGSFFWQYNPCTFRLQPAEWVQCYILCANPSLLASLCISLCAKKIWGGLPVVFKLCALAYWIEAALKWKSPPHLPPYDKCQYHLNTHI